MGQTKGHTEKSIDGMGKYEKCIQKRKTNVCMWSCNYQDVHQGRQGQTDTCKTQMKSKKVANRKASWRRMRAANRPSREDNIQNQSRDVRVLETCVQANT
jgi:hypothetical protein